MENFLNSKNIFKKNLPIILAFIIPILGLFFIYIGRGIYPFGSEMYLRSDMYHQYATFLREFQRMLKEGDNLLYTWKIGLGTDFFSTYAYYLASPVNWLVAFLPSKFIPEIMSCFIVCKAGLMSATFTYYVQKHFKVRDFIAPAFGIFYGMSSYMCAYSWNLMWLDCLVLLPLIVLGLEHLINEKKCSLYTICLAVSIFSNYYISIMICIFLVLYFLYAVICERNKGVNIFGAFVRFAGYSVLAGLMAAATVIPAFVALSATASGDFNFPTNLKAYYNMLEMFAHACMSVEPTVLSGYIPNTYCTVAFFIFVPIYVIEMKLRLRERIGKVILLGIFLVSFMFNIPTYIWHGFHYPNSLSSRQSFIYIFLVLVIGYEVMSRIREFGYFLISICAALGIGAIIALYFLYKADTYPIYIVLTSAGFAALYFVWIILLKAGRIPQVGLIIAFLIICTTEACVNTEITGYTTTDRTIYYSDNIEISALLENIDDNGFYRIDKDTRRTKNDACWNNYYGASEFSSTTLAGVTDMYKAFGFQASTNAFSYYGRTPVTSAMLGVKYEIWQEFSDSPFQILKDENGDQKLYENVYSLSLGYMADNNIIGIKDLDNSNPFKVQNAYIEGTCGVKNVFTVNDYKYKDDEEITAKASGRGYVYISEKIDKAEVTVYRGNELITTITFNSLEDKHILDIGDVEAKDRIIIASKDDEKPEVGAYSAVLDYKKLDEAMTLLADEQLKVQKLENNYVLGTITAEKDGLMMTSIPYYEGWEVFIDGEKADVTPFMNALIMVTVPAGTHSVEFRYHSPSFVLALVISGVSVILFIGVMCANAAKRRKLKKYIESKEQA